MCAALETNLAYLWVGFIGYTGYQWKLTSGSSDLVSMRKEMDGVPAFRSLLLFWLLPWIRLPDMADPLRARLSWLLRRLKGATEMNQ